jgi:hypothetical protein
MPDTLDTAVVAGDDDAIAGDERTTVELRLSSIDDRGVVRPPGLAGAPVDAVQNAVAGADEQEISRDRGRREDSATSLVFPVRGLLDDRRSEQEGKQEHGEARHHDTSRSERWTEAGNLG